MKTTELDPNAAAAAQPDPNAAKPQPKEKTKEDLAAIEEFTDKLLGRDEESKKKDAEKEAARQAAEKETKAKKGGTTGKTEKTDEEKAAEAAAAEAAKKNKAAPKPAAAHTASAPDVTAISQAVADGIRAATAAKTPDKAKPADDDFELPANEKRKVAVLERMEADMPEKYKGRAKQYVDQLKAAEKYASDWERRNSGKAFDENDPEHAEFFDKQDVDWNDDDFRDTEIAIAAEKIVEKRMGPVNQEFEALKREKKLQAETPKINGQRDQAAKEYWDTIGENFGKLLKPDGTVDKEVFAELDKTDPVGLSVTLHYAAKVVEPVAAEIYKLSEGLVPYDPKNRMHADIGEFATLQENAILEMPSEKQIDGRGRKFATSEEWAKLTDRERAGRWYLTAERLTKLFTAEKASEAKEIAEREREKIKKYAGAYTGQPAATTAKTPEKQREIQSEEDESGLENDNGKPVTPSTTGAPRVAGTGKPGDSEADKKVLNWAIS